MVFQHESRRGGNIDRTSIATFKNRVNCGKLDWMTTATTKKPTHTEAELDTKMADIRDHELEAAAQQQAKSANFPYLNLRFFPVDTGALFLVEEPVARQAGIAVIAKTGTTLTIATQDPASPAMGPITQDLTKKGFVIRFTIVSAHSLATAWERYKYKKQDQKNSYGVMHVDQQAIEQFETQIQDIKDLKERITSLPITQVLNAMIAGALKIGASDIHFEPEEREIRLRYRLDGVLTDVVSFPSSEYPEILSRVKLDSGLKINVHSAPQDGRFTIRLKDKDLEVRVSILPGAYGENIVMRLLDPSSIRQKLEDLGMRDDTLELTKKLLKKNTGTILTTGPTGSGKTTTLYAFLQYINTPDVKIITIEDPIEYHIEGISQTQVSDAAGYSFVEGLRSIVRQDPDVILVGEIRDQETAEITMQAALTGHLVLSTIHTNNAAGTIPRLIDLGVRPVTMAPAINAAMAQRLVRRLCQTCKKNTTVKHEDYELLKRYLEHLPAPVAGVPEINEKMEVFYPVGCTACAGSGYKGRIGVYEIFEIDNEMQKLILTSPALADVQELAVKKGLTTLLQDALIKAANGITSIDEVMRVIGE